MYDALASAAALVEQTMPIEAFADTLEEFGSLARSCWARGRRWLNSSLEAAMTRRQSTCRNMIIEQNITSNINDIINRHASLLCWPEPA